MFIVRKQILNFDNNFKRITARCITSIVPEIKLKDFDVKNEPILQYLEGSRERKELEDALQQVSSNIEEVPIVIGDKEFKTDNTRYQVMPHNHQHKVCQFHYATEEMIKKAIVVASQSQKSWDQTPISQRLEIWEKAASLMSNKYRQVLNATTMLGQSKTIIQAEIDSACELIDFFRINAYFLKESLKYQPISENLKVSKNSMRYRGIEGFVASITPFNFTAIGGNLAYTPALVGNSILWKPSDTAILSNWTIFKICREAGIPAGVVNFIPAEGPLFGKLITSSQHLAGINFTGSSRTFKTLWSQIGLHIGSYRNFPRIIGECGGKNFHFIHPSADVRSVVNATIKAAFEYSGQKCSACSRMYVPQSLWEKIKEPLLEAHKKLKIADPTEFDTFTSAVIDSHSFKKIKSFIDHARRTSQILAGGHCDDSSGYFIQPTIIKTSDPKDKIMIEEIFGPVLGIYVYEDKDIDHVLRLVDQSTSYALTGAIFAQDQKFLKHAIEVLKMAAGNLYINDKSTGSVVGQQPFGGARQSGTNDKAGGPHYLLRWTNPQIIKETFVPLTEISYPYMQQNY